MARHARARTASVRVSRTDEGVAVEIADGGAGGADPARGTGLAGLADRLAALDGELLVTSRAGRGTVVTARLPCGGSRSARAAPTLPARVVVPDLRRGAPVRFAPAKPGDRNPSAGLRRNAAARPCGGSRS